MRFLYFLLILAFSWIACNNPVNENTIKQNNITGRDLKIDLLRKKADLLYKHDIFLEAVRYFDSLIFLDSLKGEYFYKRGFSYSRLVERKKAIDDFEKAASLNFKISSSYYNIAINYSFDNDSLSLYYLEKCIKADPGDSDAYAEILECKKRLKEKKSMHNEMIPVR